MYLLDTILLNLVQLRNRLFMFLKNLSDQTHPMSKTTLFSIHVYGYCHRMLFSIFTEITCSVPRFFDKNKILISCLEH